MSSAMLRVEGLSWGPKRGPTILYSATFTVLPGCILGIVGANGAGKSTLLRLLYRYLKPDSGQVFLDDQDIWSMTTKDVARSIAVVLQEQPTDFALTVREIVALGRIPHLSGFMHGSTDDESIVMGALSQLNLSAFSERMFGTLSGGERQRVMVARALAQQPRLLILDEPTNHLDIRHQLEVLALIEGLGLTVVTSLHDINLAATHTDQVLVLSQGKTLICGPPHDVLTEDRIAQSFGVRTALQHLHPSGDPHLTFHL